MLTNCFCLYAKYVTPLRPLEGKRATKWRRGVLRCKPEWLYDDLTAKRQPSR